MISAKSKHEMKQRLRMIRAAQINQRTHTAAPDTHFSARFTHFHLITTCECMNKVNVDSYGQRVMPASLGVAAATIHVQRMLSVCYQQLYTHTHSPRELDPCLTLGLV